MDSWRWRVTRRFWIQTAQRCIRPSDGSLQVIWIDGAISWISSSWGHLWKYARRRVSSVKRQASPCRWYERWRSFLASWKWQTQGVLSSRQSVWTPRGWHTQMKMWVETRVWSLLFGSVSVRIAVLKKFPTIKLLWKRALKTKDLEITALTMPMRPWKTRGPGILGWNYRRMNHLWHSGRRSTWSPGRRGNGQQPSFPRREFLRFRSTWSGKSWILNNTLMWSWIFRSYLFSFMHEFSDARKRVFALGANRNTERRE